MQSAQNLVTPAANPVFEVIEASLSECQHTVLLNPKKGPKPFYCFQCKTNLRPCFIGCWPEERRKFKAITWNKGSKWKSTVESACNRSRREALSNSVSGGSDEMGYREIQGNRNSFERWQELNGWQEEGSEHGPSLGDLCANPDLLGSEDKARADLLEDEIRSLSLTDKEHEVFEAVLLGYKEREIARLLKISQQRVHSIKLNIRSKAVGVVKTALPTS